MNPVLHVENLTTIATRRGVDNTVVDGVNLSLPAGGSLAIVGESGAGKSMLIRSILGIHPPGVSMRVSGRVMLDGHDMLSLRGRAHRRALARSVGMVHQDPLRSLNPTFRVGTQLTEALSFAGSGGGRRGRTARAIDAMREVGFRSPDVESRRYPHELSGGQRQRIGISAATLTEPALLIGDEPTTALDVIVQKRVLDLMDEMRERTGASLLLVTHDLGVAAERCDEIVVMRAGKIVEAGRTTTMLSAPTHPYTRSLLESIPRLDGPRPHRLPTPAEGALS
ncbi:ABC-type dipeptide/oligopeptide/nickel transport system ATPase component [Microbacterium natoriense]|uniref:ABC-type dipeptide/oligopeptide/nickel transport system ATPase component n=1 Tax=Microbacterium natoriense TaxID=284570 RepID=A0AAW8EW39_9MICO|nr:ABC transporter ATP-binding protein [Microbacterium natoriense]MDQ0647044.1 ABC-type dipeptide/oligopeptide/nickel transport system ATPase component [Microbacterium natoriense]